MLTQGMDALSREIVSAYDARAVDLSRLHKATRTGHDARVAALSRLRRATRTQLARFTADRKVLATRQRADLARERTELATHNVGRHALATRQRADLAKSEAARSAGVRAWMRPITADRVAAHESWRSLAVAMHGKRTSATTASVREPVAGQAAPLEPTAVATGQ